MASKGFLVTAILCSLVLVSCSGKGPEQVQMFQGPCKLRVTSADKEDEILIDGVKAGYGSLDLKVPCGYREVRLRRPHHIEFKQYVDLVKGTPQEVTGTPKPLGEIEDYALSRTLIERLKAGKTAFPSADEKSEQQESKAPTTAPVKENQGGAQPDAPKEEKSSDDWS